MQNADFKRLIDQLPIGACIIDEQRVIKFVNSVFYSRLSSKDLNLENKHILDTFTEQTRFLKRKIDSVFALKNPSFSYWQQRPHVFPMTSSRPITGDESQMYQNVQFMPLFNDGDDVTHICIVVTDVTAEASYFTAQQALKTELEHEHHQLMELHDELKLAQKSMLQSEKMASIGHLAAGVAHEINNPMGFVHSNLETLQDYSLKLIKTYQVQRKVLAKQAEKRFLLLLDDVYERHSIEFVIDDLPELLTESLEGTKRIKNIVHSLHDFAVQDDEWSDVDLIQEINSALMVLKAEIDDKVELIRQLPDTSVVLRCKPASIRRLLINVMTNALQAMPAAGSLTVACKNRDEKIYLCISDTGIGMDEAQLDLIFNPFYTTKDVGIGTGLGLSQTYSIVKDLKGEVNVKSEVGKGSHFEFVFPTLTT
ncbi:ATP-binding protein [uncultured Pseudoalteromonas sp.]|uniref:ATP-binding protein n=1 Tax=uncultured Pseudoalteromonas sp. TaxID=114053 RepID=UPI00259431E7|nr:ATP-binding protein [uncultured Pseudoalteromonas sp.]